MTTPPTAAARRRSDTPPAAPAKMRDSALPTDRRLLTLALALLFLGGSAATYAVRRIVAADAATEKAASAPTAAGSAAAIATAVAEMPVSLVELDGQLADAVQPRIEELPQYADPFGERFPSPPTPPDEVRGFANRAAAPPSPPTEIAPPDLRSRLTEWQRQCREAKRVGQTCASRLSAYLVDELLPIGTVRVRAERSVWIYVQPEKVTFTVPLRSRFHDATLIDANVEGAVFQTARGETKIVGWSASPDIDIAPGRSIASPNSETTPSSPPTPAATPASEEPPAAIPPDRLSTPADEARGGEQGERRRTARPSRTADPASDLDELQNAVRERYRRPAKTTSRRTPIADAPGAQPAPLSGRITVEKVGRDDVSSDDDKLPAAYGPHPRLKADLIASAMPFDVDRLTPTLFADDAPATHDASAASDAPRFRPALFAVDEVARPRVARPTVISFPPATYAPPAAPIFSAAVERGAEQTTAPPGGQTRERTTNPLCDPTYIGEPISVETTRPLTFSDLVRTINTSFKANIVLDNEVQNLPVNLTFVDAPWNQILRTQLDLNDLDVICAEGNNLVQIAKRSKIAQIQEQKRKGAAIVREVFRLRYLQPTAGGRTDLAGRVQGGAGATLQSLDETIREILRAGGDARAEFRRIPGRNEFLVAATAEQIAEIRRLIERVDRPGYQVVIRALVYNVNEDRLTDVGSQLAAVVGNGGQTNLGGFTTLPNTPRGNNTGGNVAPVDGRNPGGIPTPGRNFGIPGGLEAAAPTGVLGVTTIVGTAQFAYQLTLAQNRGLINIQSRPFGVVSDGDTFDLVSGVQIPVVTAAIAGGSALSFGQVQFIEASRIARITPQVAEAEDGRAGFITLLIQLENNDVASVLYNGYPGVNRQSLQTVMRLRNNETAVIGGLSTDAVQRNQTKVPGLGNIPGLGWLFKRRFDQQSRSRLYFAISVEVIDQSQNIQSFPAPADAITAPPPPPAAQRPSPYEKRPQNN